MSDSKNKKEAKGTGEKQEKVLTKYDLKVQRRERQKAIDARNKKIGTAVGILIAAALVVLVASFPIRSYLTVNGTYVTIGGDKVTKVEFDYNYNIAKNKYLSQNSYWLSYLGLDLSGNLSMQMYSEDMSWQDFFEEMTVDYIIQNKALFREAKENGFVYDTAEEYNEYLEMMKRYAADRGITAKAYIQELYGPYATEDRVRPYIEQAMYAGAYYSDVVKKLAPSQEEIQNYYNENKNEYDSVDYRVKVVYAVLPTEPTELADPVQTEAPADGSGSDQTGTNGTEEKYEPSEAEIAAAMKEAKAEAESTLRSIRTEGEQAVGVTWANANTLVRDWLFDAERKPGDTTVLEDATYHRYYVLAFEKRYLDDTRTADIRVIMTKDGNGQAIYDEWKSAATEQNFAALYDKYNDSTVLSAEGGLLEGVSGANLADELRDWIFSSERVGGDAAVIAPEGKEYEHVVYYVAPGREEWVISIESTLQSERADKYLEELTGTLEVEDKSGNLNYLKVYAAREKAEAEKTPEPADGTSTGKPEESSPAE